MASPPPKPPLRAPMFERDGFPRVFGVAPGVDFGRAIVDGIAARLDRSDPMAPGRVRILVNTHRMARRLAELYAQGPAGILPRIDLITDPGALAPLADIPPALSPLERRLDLARLIRARIEAEPGLAPQSSVLDLADSLTRLIDERHGESVRPEDIAALDVGGLSEHWQRSKTFLSIVQTYLDSAGLSGGGPEARRGAAVDRLLADWREDPPDAPVILAGSTGSRGTTFRLMCAVAGLPQGAVVLPGFDFDLPDPIWSALTGPEGGHAAEDHPQYRFARLLAHLDLAPSAVGVWSGAAIEPARNALMSLALRPAPVTHQWRTDGPSLGQMDRATENLSLIVAAQPREEALAIAVALRLAVENRKRAVLITPDRVLGRRVAAALGRWGIVPDDSGGKPLALSPPGRFLRSVARMAGQPVEAEPLIALLKHPLARSGVADRGEHLRQTRELELFLRRNGLLVVDSAVLNAAAATREISDDWVAWLSGWIGSVQTAPGQTIGQRHDAMIALAETLAESGDGTGGLWEKEAGQLARAACAVLAEAPVSQTAVERSDFLRVLDQVLAEDEARTTVGIHPDVMIWGTLEARVQGADFVVLGGLNEGIWPARPDPDPWLSRSMRRSAGLLSPEREIGLSAHDFQQAVAAPEVVLSRARRDAEAETVPARWMNRLTNLLGGLSGQGGPEALKAMERRGARYLQLARTLDAPRGKALAAPRIAPAPPPDARPKSFSVTDIERLVRDPYHFYADKILSLRKLSPLIATPDYRFRGIVFHAVMKRFIDQTRASQEVSESAFFRLLETEIDSKVPWPAVRVSWKAHLSAISGHMLEGERARQAAGVNLATEIGGAATLPGSPFEIRCTADRIDRRNDGGLVVYDYKTGSPPTKAQVAFFRPQLLLEAIIAESGGFRDIAAAPVVEAAYLTLSKSASDVSFDMNTIKIQNGPVVDIRPPVIAAETVRLLEHFMQESQGYVPRRAVEEDKFEGDFDHLSRFGEWNDSEESLTVPVP